MFQYRTVSWLKFGQFLGSGKISKPAFPMDYLVDLGITSGNTVIIFFKFHSIIKVHTLSWKHCIHTHDGRIIII